MREPSETTALRDIIHCNRTSVEDLMARRIAAAFVLYSLFAIAFLAVNMPPFQNPDELAHFQRAAQLADGRLTGTRLSIIGANGKLDITAGGASDPALHKAFQPFNAMIFHPDTRATIEDWTPRVHWSREREMEKFPNTVINPPFFYVPSVIGVLAGRLTRMTVVQTLMVSRTLTGVAATAVAAAAIACAGGAAPWIFAVLTLPMSLSLIASASQDALMLTCAALASSLMVRMARDPGKRNARALVGIAISLGLVAMARPAYGALALLPVALPNVRWRWRLLAACVVVGCVLVWSGINAFTSMTNFGGVVGAEPAAQVALLLRDPFLVVQVGWTTAALNWLHYLDGFVGRLGWLDTVLPTWYQGAALVGLCCGAVAASLGLPKAPGLRGGRLIIAAALLLSAAGVFASLYVAWTVPGNATVDGVQGRYFLPLAVAGASLLPSLGVTRWTWPHKSLVGAVVAFPLVTLMVVMRTVVLRYYLG